MSSRGVPSKQSIASSSTDPVTGSSARITAVATPTGLGRTGERSAKTPRVPGSWRGDWRMRSRRRDPSQ